MELLKWMIRKKTMSTVAKLIEQLHANKSSRWKKNLLQHATRHSQSQKRKHEVHLSTWPSNATIHLLHSQKWHLWQILKSDSAEARKAAAEAIFQLNQMQLLLARIMLAFSDSIPKIIDSGAIRASSRPLTSENDVCVRASAAEALEVLSLKSTKAKKAAADSQGVPILIGAVVAPSKECMQGEGRRASAVALNTSFMAL
ncbi:hypothetical protein HAX54_048038 [Datura stramonium]|uniref:Uncharacterized protein n=1 Tax=Datura stramonium TaxID=4076 RepID=A0ABS8STN6_DATST|nr:hypothetical protein [Datura stramonium]